MPRTSRDIPEWRQGNVLADEVVVRLGLASSADVGNTVAIVVSHDCDIAAPPDREPEVEIVIGHRIPALGSDTNAKTARRLHIAFHQGEVEIPVELMMTTKTARPKAAVLATRPKADIALDLEARVVLQHWLGARYNRAAFADEFERRLRDSKLADKIAKAMKAAGEHVLAVFFDVDSGENVEREGLEDLYQLRITLLYDSTKNEPVAYEAAHQAAGKIEQDFETAMKADGKWRGIKLQACEAQSDSAMTVAQSRMLKRWKLDHISFADDPPQPLLPPN
jgi:hypothetical protein